MVSIGRIWSMHMPEIRRGIIILRHIFAAMDKMRYLCKDNVRMVKGF